MWYGPVLRIDLNPGSTESKDSTRGRAANSLVGAHFGFFHNSAQEGVASGGYREDGLTFRRSPRRWRRASLAAVPVPVGLRQMTSGKTKVAVRLSYISPSFSCKGPSKWTKGSGATSPNLGCSWAVMGRAEVMRAWAKSTSLGSSAFSKKKP